LLWANTPQYDGYRLFWNFGSMDVSHLWAFCYWKAR
jgi:hypothetical protein